MRKVVSPVVQLDRSTSLYYVDFSFCEHRLGGSALAQTLNRVGDSVPTVENSEYFADAFDAVQKAINEGLILAGHDISAGGLITTLLEMTFANTEGGLRINLTGLAEEDLVKILFAENPGVVLQVKDGKSFEKLMEKAGVAVAKIGYPCDERTVSVRKGEFVETFDIDALRDVWYESSHLLDRKQSGTQKADERFANYKHQPLYYLWPKGFTFANYRRLFTDTTLFNFPRWFLNTLFVACCCCVITTILTLMVAYVYSRLRFPARKALMNVSLVLGMFPGFMSMIAIYHFLKAIGLDQTLLALILVYSGGAALNYYIANKKQRISHRREFSVFLEQST